MLIIPEGDIYRLITHSKLPSAERFEKWVFDEVLPSIRKTGSYSSNDITMEQRLEAMRIISKCTRYTLPYAAALIKTVYRGCG